MIYEYVWSAVMKSFLDDESSAPSFNVDALTFMEEICLQNIRAWWVWFGEIEIGVVFYGIKNPELNVWSELPNRFLYYNRNI